LSALYLNEKTEDANERLLARAREYVDLHRSDAVTSRFEPEEATETPWSYFALTDYVRILCLFHSKSPHYPGRLTAETEAAMKEALWHWVKTESTVEWASLNNLLLLLGTENHDLTRRPNHYLISSILKDDPAFRDRRYYDGHTPAEHAEAYQRFFREWPRKRAGTGLWIEIGSNTYQKYSWPALFNLHDLAPDRIIRNQFGMLLDLACVEEAQISVNGRRGGGRSRAAGGRNGFESYKNLLYAPENRAAHSSHSKVIETSLYQAPAAAILLRKREFPTAEPFVIRNRVLGEQAPNRPRDGKANRFASDSALVNYAYRTPHYLLGSTLQDPSLTLASTDPKTGVPQWGYGGISRQKRACGMLFEDPSGDQDYAIYPVIEQTRGGRPQHSFWSVQHENVLILQRIAPQTRRRFGSYSTGVVGICFDGEGFEKLETKGWIFASHKGVFVAVRFLDGPHQWDETRKTVNPANFDHSTDTSRILFHAGDITSHQSFKSFQQAVLSNQLTITSDQVEYRVGRVGKKATQLVVTRFDVTAPNAFTLPTVNGKPINLRPEMTWHSPYLNGRFGDGKVSIRVGPVEQVLDFSRE
jgi:hypothetical protein